MKKMNPINLLLLVVILVFSKSLGSEARAINDDIDNSIESGSSQKSDSSDTLIARTRLGIEWIKFMKIPPVKIMQKYGAPIEISCEVMGSPLPSIQWVVGSVPLSEIEPLESNVITESSSSSIVKVRSVHVIDHILNEPLTYTCVGNTGSKTIYASTIVYPQTDKTDILRVQEKQMRPRIIYNERMHLDVEGSNIVLPCKVHARPRAEVFWMNDDGSLIEQNQRYKLLPSGDLLIAGLKWEDMGTYKCIARNALGKDSIDTFVYPVKAEK